MIGCVHWQYDNNPLGMTAGGESDIGSVDGMMPEEVEAAYQVFMEIMILLLDCKWHISNKHKMIIK